MRWSPQLLPAIAAAGLILASCGGSQSSPVLRNYQSSSGKPVITPDSLCIKQPGGGYQCSGRDQEPCSISSQTFATEPTNTNRTTIGVGEVVNITTTGESLSVSGDGTLNQGSSPATLTAGATGGTVTVSTPGKYQICLANSLTFTVIPPSAVLYSAADGNVFHTQTIANIGVLGNVYLQPDTVSFQYVQYYEVPTNFTASGAWSCISGTTHNPASVSVQVGTDVPGYGSEVAGGYHDEAHSGSCTGNQTQASSESVTYPGEYSLDGSTFYPIMTITQTATETVAGAMTITKPQETGSTTVSSSNEGW